MNRPRMGTGGFILRLALCAAAAAFPMPAGRAAPPSSVSLVGYRALLHDYRVFLESEDPDSDVAARLADRFSRAAVVINPDGQRYVVSNAQEVETLHRFAKGDADDLSEDERAHGLLLCEMVTHTGKAAAFTLRKDPTKAAAAITARPEFHYRKPTPKQKTWLDTLGDRIGDAITQFFRWLAGNRATKTPEPTGLAGLAAFVRFLLITLAAVAAGLGLWFLVTRVYRSGLRGKRQGGPGSGETGLDIEEGVAPDALRAAWDSADRGDYRTAVRLAYIACLRRLSAAGMLVMEPQRTNWEYQRALRRRYRPASETLMPATQLFDRLWYGGQTGAREQFEAMVAIYDRLPQTPPSQDTPARSETAAPSASAAADRRNPW